MIKQMRFLGLVVMLTVAVTSCGGGGTTGACVPKAAPYSCGNDFTSGECHMMNGNFYSGQSCSEIGHRSS